MLSLVSFGVSVIKKNSNESFRGITFKLILIYSNFVCLLLSLHFIETSTVQFIRLRTVRPFFLAFVHDYRLFKSNNHHVI